MGITAGCLIILISIAHFIYGEKKQIPHLVELRIDAITIGSTRIMIYQGGMMLLATGIVQLAVGLDSIDLQGAAKYFPVGLILINVLTALVLAAFVHREVFRVTIPQFIFFAVVILLQILAL